MSWVLFSTPLVYVEAVLGPLASRELGRFQCCYSVLQRVAGCCRVLWGVAVPVRLASCVFGGFVCFWMRHVARMNAACCTSEGVMHVSLVFAS